MKQVVNLLIFSLLIAALVSMASCKKSSKKRSTGYYCYAWHEYAHDTILINTVYFDYPYMTPSQQADTLNAHFNVPGYWYTCSY